MGINIIQDGKRYTPAEFIAVRKKQIAAENQPRIAALLAGINKVFTSAAYLNGVIEDAKSCGLVICNTRNTVVAKFEDEWGKDNISYVTDTPEPRERSTRYETVKTKFTVRQASQPVQ
ncbi:MAG: hypothetical protein WC479_12235 [Candidatus Izemoplasmatales bacterium]